MPPVAAKNYLRLMLDVFPVENPNSIRGDLFVAGDAVIVLAVVER